MRTLRDFGLLGHAFEMMGKNTGQVGVKIDYKAIPLFDGVDELFAKGYYASIAEENYRSLSAVLSAEVNAVDLSCTKPSPEGEGWVRGNQNKEESLFAPPHPNLLPEGEGVRTLKSTALSADVSHQKFPALFDPQTSGGLLFSVPSDQAQECLNALHQNGVAKACVIGEVIDQREIVVI
ncbi:AIR synthase-related protein [Methylobacter tundripaludum]|uniref:AIR synthase-related protein n=1 Tax=Methylobacter tundripaludum TaxID=173365 RepID=UPI0001E51216|nr:AIR synthase-related protein [Methylobacter tundripaludum]